MPRVKHPIQAGDGDPRHGTEGGYTNHSCRCDECRRTWTDACLRRREERAAVVLDEGDPRHGTESLYFNHKCRCGSCKSAHAKAERTRVQRRKQAQR